MALTPSKLIPISMSLFMGCLNMSMFLTPYIFNAIGGVLGGGIVGAFRAAAILTPLCAVAAVFMFALRRGARINN
jgi:hypothetical protein